MTYREKLIELVSDVRRKITAWHTAEDIADMLIANGVIIPVRCKDCRYYNEDGEYCGNWGEVRHPEHFCDEGVRDND